VRRSQDGRTRRGRGRVVALVAAGALVAGCGTTGSSVLYGARARPGTIVAVGAENQYADVISQIGGRYVSVTAIMSDPNTDPHTFEASASVAKAVSAAKLVVQNGLGYDGFMNKIESASSSSARKVIDVQELLGLPDSTPNPHLWYRPATMPAVARTLGADLSALQPGHAAYFRAHVASFIASLGPWRAAITKLRSSYPGFRVATTEPVGDYLLQAAGADDLTPFGLQADIMNGVDPAPQYVATEEKLLSAKEVEVFVYNQQVTDPLTETFLRAAKKDGIPVVGVYETMPTPGYTYQSWMLAETRALQDAVADHTSAERL
jgi:zinc/manganese transport system substrate-binding protein